MKLAYKFFYQPDNISNLISAEQSRTVFRTADHLLAEKISGEPTVSFIGIDKQGSVLRDGDSKIEYSPYGNVSGPVTPAMPHRFNSEVLDPFTQCYVLGSGYRAYSPSLMRFNLPDNLSPFSAGGLNSYAYCAGDPVNNSDPSGHFPLFPSFRNFKGKPIKVSGFGGVVMKAKDPTNKSQSVLTIVAHGLPGKMQHRESPQPVTPKDLYHTFERAGHSLKGQKVHLITCYSAAPPRKGEDSFARALSRLTDAPVIGYKVVVSSDPPFLTKDGVNYKILERATFFQNLAGKRSAKNIRVVEDANHQIRR